MTRKELTNSFSKVLRIGYCDLQDLTAYCKKIGYNSGVYGWNWDAFILNYDVAICTGYRSMAGDNISSECKKEINKAIKEYEENHKSGDWHKTGEEVRKIALEILFKHGFIKEWQK